MQYTAPSYNAPPFFHQGWSALGKLIFFTVLSVMLLVADARMHSLVRVRQAIGVVLYPIERIAIIPRDVFTRARDYWTSAADLRQENQALKLHATQLAQVAQSSQALAAENNQLRNLMGARGRMTNRTLLTEILYDARDPFTRKVVIDRGTLDGVSAGMPVIDDLGVVGQITRVFPFIAEVTLLTDKEQTIPVQVVRNGVRTIAYGGAESGMLDLRFMASNADIAVGDALVTSGLDGIYPAGLEVAKVVRIEKKSTDAFGRIVCQPISGLDRHKHLLVLLPDGKILPPPPPVEAEKSGRRKNKTEIETKPTVPIAAAPNSAGIHSNNPGVPLNNADNLTSGANANAANSSTKNVPNNATGNALINSQSNSASLNTSSSHKSALNKP